MTLRMRVLPRFPAAISGTNGLKVTRPTGTPNLIVEPDFGSLVQIPNVGDGETVFFMALDEEIGLYRKISFADLFAGVTDLGFMEEAVYDPQGKHADAFDRANHTGTQAVSTVSGLQAALDAKASLTGAETLTNKTLTAPAINAPVGLFLAGSLYGLTLSNDAGDLTNDIAIAVGSAASDAATPSLITLASSLVKRTDAAWAAGTNQGGWLDGASMPNGTGHVFLIYGASGVDVGISASLAPTLPAGYNTGKRRIGSILREAATIVAFTQKGDVFLRKTLALDRSSTAAAASALLGLSVPAGIVVEPLLSFSQVMSGAGSIATQLNSAGSTSLLTITQTTAASEVAVNSLEGGIFTNTSRQIQFAVVSGGGTLSQNDLNTRGWIDDRGRS